MTTTCQVWSVVSLVWRLCRHEIYFFLHKFVYKFGRLFHFCIVRTKIYDRFTVFRSCWKFKTFAAPITFWWQVMCWHFWKTSVGYSRFNSFLPMFSQPWATLTVEPCRSGFSYDLCKEWISSWKSQLTGKREHVRQGISSRKLVLSAQGHHLPWHRRPHRVGLWAQVLFLTPLQRQRLF